MAVGRPHSCGGVYISMNNVIRGERFLQRNVQLVTTIPGPKEPKLLQLNHILDPVVQEFHQLYASNLFISMFMEDS